MAYGITSEAELIDIGAFKNSCANIKRIANDFDGCKKLVNQAHNMLNEQAFSADGVTFQPKIRELSEALNQQRAYIDSYVNELATWANNIYQQQLAELKEYQKSLESKE